jgi:hypothetical protein
MFDHDATIKRFKTLSDDALKYIAKDCQQAIDAFADNPKNSEYMDTIHYANMELVSRRDFIVGDENGRHVEVSVSDSGFDCTAILHTRPDGEKVIARAFASRTLKTRKGAINAAHTWLLRRQVNQS